MFFFNTFDKIWAVVYIFIIVECIMKTKNRTLVKIEEYLVISAMAVLLALNYIIFIVNNKFAPSGINGIATMIQYKFGFSIAFFSLAVNVPLAIAAFFYVNKEFAVKSFLFTVVYSVSYLLLQRIDLTSFQYFSKGTDVILPVLAASIISGFVYGAAFKMNASTGGTDIIAKLISKRHPQFNFVWVIFFINVCVAAVSYFVYAEPDESGKLIFDLKPVLLCVVYCFMSSTVGNRILSGTKTAVKFEVVTEHGAEIAQEIIDTLHHGVTINKVEGAYSKTEKDHLVCIVNKHQINEFEKILSKYPDTFAYINTVSETVGNFKKVK